MSRSVPAALLAHYQKSGTTLCHVLRITRKDSFSVGYNSTEHDITVSGFLYEAGLDISNVQTPAGLAVGNMMIDITPDHIFNAADLLAGLWNDASFSLGIVNWQSTSDGIDVIKSGLTGEAVVMDLGQFKLEFRGLMHALQYPLGIVTQMTCRADLGDAFCRVDLTPWTHTYPVTAAVSRHNFTAAAATEVADYYSEGKVVFTSGANAGYGTFKIKSFSAGVFNLVQPLPFSVGVGDTFTAIAGCQKRLAEDCYAKFHNVLNFQGEPHVPGQDKLLADPSAGI